MLSFSRCVGPPASRTYGRVIFVPYAHIVLDRADLGSLEAASYGLMLDLQGLVEESNYRFVLCGLSPHLKWQLKCVRLSDEFDTFDTREAAILELAPQDAY